MDERNDALSKNKSIATLLLIGAFVLFVIAQTQKGNCGWEWIASFAEAAMVGALADWFAVVALFRHPLGVPIPHTAIVANKKDSIAENLALFIQEKFLATDSLVSKFHDLNPAKHFTLYLSKKENTDKLSNGISRLITETVDFINDDRVKHTLQSSMRDQVEKFDLATSAANFIDLLRKDSRHQVVFDEFLIRTATILESQESQEKIALAIDSWCNTEYPMLSMFIPNRDQFAKGAGEKIVKRVNDYFKEVNNDPSHDLRSKFDDAVVDFITNLRTDNLLRTKLEEIKHEAINNEVLSNYLTPLLNEFKNFIIDDLNRPNSKIIEKGSSALLGIGNTLANSQALCDSINEHIETVVKSYADNIRKEFAKHISGTIKQWDNAAFVREIELSIGSDLQFIRMNGTLVGGLIGLVLHAVSLLFK